MVRKRTQRKTPGRKPLYPWRTWLGAKNHVQVLEKGKHFTCTVRSMEIMIRQRAMEREISVSVQIAGHVVILTNRGPRQPANVRMYRREFGVK